MSLLQYVRLEHHQQSSLELESSQFHPFPLITKHHFQPLVQLHKSYNLEKALLQQVSIPILIHHLQHKQIGSQVLQLLERVQGQLYPNQLLHVCDHKGLQTLSPTPPKFILSILLYLECICYTEQHYPHTL
jgi:hypothetical protein